MLAVINQTPEKITVQFTGADLKEWYREREEDEIFICYVVASKISELLGHARCMCYVNSEDLINMLRTAVPNRFRANPTYSSTVHRHMLKKYWSRGNFSNFLTRKNLINAVADDFIFTIPLTID